MPEELSESRIVRSLAHEACRRITRRVIREFQQRNGKLLSGEDPGLRSAWEEICVQVQAEESVFWDAYLEDLKQALETEVERLRRTERQAVWLQTTAGEEWDYNDEDSREPNPVPATQEIVEYITNKYVLAEAADWSNRRIRKFLEDAIDHD